MLWYGFLFTGCVQWYILDNVLSALTLAIARVSETQSTNEAPTALALALPGRASEGFFIKTCLHKRTTTTHHAQKQLPQYEYHRLHQSH